MLTLRTFRRATLTLTAIVAACAGPRSQTVRLGGTSAVATRGDLRVITERPDLHPGAMLGAHQVVCAEPSPDVALALGTALSLQANAKTPAGVDAGVTASRSTTEAVTALAGRTAAVVALRDGLFRACEGYANGVIGRDAYGLILSQYGDLLVTLMLGEDAAASAHPTSSGGGAGATPADPVAAIAKNYFEAADERRRTAAFVLCTLAAERSRESGGGATPSDPSDPRCGGTPTPPAGK